MQASGNFGGALATFRDPGTGQPVTGSAHGTYVVDSVHPQDVNLLLPQINGALLNGLNQVIAQKLASNQVALPTLQQSLPYFQQEIAAAAGLDRMGLTLVQFNASVNIQGPPAAPAFSGPLPPDPMQATANAFQNRLKDELDPRNKVVEAEVEIGGFKIKGSTDGGLDTKGIGDQVVSKVKTELVWYAIGCVVVGLVLVGLLALGGYIVMVVMKSGGTAAASKQSAAAAWDGKTMLNCGGNDKLKIKGVTAKISAGPAINAGANCELELEGVDITAPIGINAGGNAKVTVNGGSINGSDMAVTALGSSQVTLKGTKVTGKTQALGGKITGP